MTLKDKFDNLQESQKVAIWNDYATANGFNHVESNDDDTLELAWQSVSEFAQACTRDNYCYRDDYFYIDDYGYVTSFNHLDDCPAYYWYDLEGWLRDTEYDLDNI